MTASATSRLPVIVLFNQSSPHTRPEDRAAEVGVLDAVGSVVSALSRAGYSVETLGLEDDVLPLADRFRGGAPAVVVNLCESLAARPAAEAHVAGVLELLGVSYTGSPPKAILLCLDKIRTKQVLSGCGLPTPPFFEFQADHAELTDEELEKELAEHRLTWPAIVKPAAQDASEGIRQDSVVRNVAELRAAVDRVAQCYGFPVLVEQYIAGRELCVAVIEDPEPVALPILEVVFDRGEPTRWPITTYEAKWMSGSVDDRSARSECPAKLDEATTRQLGQLAKAAVRHTGCRDYARIDLRLNLEGQPFILEVNSNPDLSPSGCLDWQLEAAGIPYNDFIVRLVERAARRRREESTQPASELKPDSLAQPSQHDEAACSVPIEFRPLLPTDREAIQELLASCDNFRAQEIKVGLELVNEALVKTGVEDYKFIIATLEGRLVGYSCFGMVPMSEDVWDLYWIAVHPAARRLGVGSRLQAMTERHIKSAGGRMVLAETSSLPDYAPARNFYMRHGYKLLARLADFYRLGDDRLTFGKRL